MLEGDVLRGSDGHNAVNLRLVDAAMARQISSERDTLLDSDVSAPFSVRLRNLTSRVRSPLFRVEVSRVMAESPAVLSPPELVLRASAVWEKDAPAAGCREALKLVDEALRSDPDLVPALTSRAQFINWEGDVDPNQDRDRIAREQDELTSRDAQDRAGLYERVLSRNTNDDWTVE